MRKTTFATRLVAGLVLGLTLPSMGAAADRRSAEAALRETVLAIEDEIGARVGVVVRDGGSDYEWAHRRHERFLMASTFKSVLCAAVLERVDRRDVSLSEEIPIDRTDIVDYAPVTEDFLGQTLSVEELCLATLDISDNAAANLLIERLGGPQAVTAFARGIGDDVTRLDRIEPDLNRFSPGDARDTTSPDAIVTTWQAVLQGDVLSVSSRAKLREWMSFGGVTGRLLRAGAPAGWSVADKSGGGREHTRNLVAMVSPPGDDPWFVAIYVSDTPASFETRHEAVAKIGAAVVSLIAAP